MALRASAIGGCRACTGCMSAMREELHHLVDLLPEAGLRPAPDWSAGMRPGITARKQTCPSSPHLRPVRTWPDARNRSSPRDPAAEVLLRDTGVLLAPGNVKDQLPLGIVDAAVAAIAERLGLTENRRA